MSQFDLRTWTTKRLILSVDVDAQSWSQRFRYALAHGIAADIDLRSADLRGADLHNINLHRALLPGVSFVDADLRSANLTLATLMFADCRGADFQGADLREAYLTGALLLDARNLPPVPVIPDLDHEILTALEHGGELDMNAWHTCDTTHCRAGWAVTLAGKEGKKLEAKYGPATAASLLYAASCPHLPIPNFYVPNEEALLDMRARVEATKN